MPAGVAAEQQQRRCRIGAELRQRLLGAVERSGGHRRRRGRGTVGSGQPSGAQRLLGDVVHARGRQGHRPRSTAANAARWRHPSKSCSIRSVVVYTVIDFVVDSIRAFVHTFLSNNCFNLYLLGIIYSFNFNK